MRLIDADRLKSYIDCGHLRPPTEVCFSELDVCNMIDKAPTVSAEAKGDLISREDALTALNGACSNWQDDSKVADIINGLPSAEPTGDLISRADAIEAVKRETSTSRLEEIGHENIISRINALPSAEEALLNAYYDGFNTASIEALQSAEANPTVVRCKTMIPYGDFREWAKRIREDNPNVIVIPCDAEVVSAEAVQGWIPCSERLPKVGENVLFTTDIYGGYVAEGDRRADGKWWQYRWNSLLQNDEVTAWMPLPKPFKGGDDE